MWRRIIIKSEPIKNLLNEEEIKIFKSWHPKKNINDIIEVWQEWKVKYIRLISNKIIWIPEYTKQELLTPWKYKWKTNEILSSALWQRI